MSFNNIKINTSIKPSSTGNISLGPNDLSDVSISSLTSGNYLKYDGSNWVNSTSTATASSLNLIFIGQGASVQYPTNWTANEDAYFYSTSVVNTISGASVSSSGSHSNWYDQVSLPSGNYMLQAAVHAGYTGSTGLLKFQFREGSSTRGAAGVNLNASNTSGTEYPADAISYVALSSTTTIAVKIITATSVKSGETGADARTNVQAERGYLMIMKVG